jgi:hypothetical protein
VCIIISSSIVSKENTVVPTPKGGFSNKRADKIIFQWAAFQFPKGGLFFPLWGGFYFIKGRFFITQRAAFIFSNFAFFLIKVRYFIREIK